MTNYQVKVAVIGGLTTVACVGTYLLGRFQGRRAERNKTKAATE